MLELLEYITLYRVVWIRGRVGFGKTAMAVLLASELLRSGLVDGVISNFPTVMPAHIGKDDGTLHNRCVVYDEAWADLDSRTSMTNDRAYGAYARKLGCYWLFPSVQPIDKRLRAIEVKPLHRNIITKQLVWEYSVKDDEKNPTTGRFSIDITRAYGMYSTSYIPVDDCGIGDRFQFSFYKETGEYYGKDSKSSRRTEIERVSDLASSLGE